jgi:hypothetical protein
MLAGNVDNCVQMFALLGLRVQGGGRWMTMGGRKMDEDAWVRWEIEREGSE